MNIKAYPAVLAVVLLWRYRWRAVVPLLVTNAVLFLSAGTTNVRRFITTQGGFERSASDTKAMLERVRLATGCGINWIGRDNTSSEALKLEEYQRRLKEVHYAVWTGDAPTYKLRASATFLDAIGMGKPLIYIKNDFIDYYNLHRGQFGLPVSGDAEMEELMIRLAGTPLDEKYKALSRAALAVSHTFSPEIIAPGLRSIIHAAHDETRKR